MFSRCEKFSLSYQTVETVETLHYMEKVFGQLKQLPMFWEGVSWVFEEFLCELLQWDRGQGSVLDSQVHPRWSVEDEAD